MNDQGLSSIRRGLYRRSPRSTHRGSSSVVPGKAAKASHPNLAELCAVQLRLADPRESAPRRSSVDLYDGAGDIADAAADQYRSTTSSPPGRTGYAVWGTQGNPAKSGPCRRRCPADRRASPPASAYRRCGAATHRATGRIARSGNRRSCPSPAPKFLHHRRMADRIGLDVIELSLLPPAQADRDQPPCVPLRHPARRFTPRLHPGPRDAPARDRRWIPHQIDRVFSG